MDALRKHVKSTLQPCSLSHWLMSEASGYFYINYCAGSVDARRKHVEFTRALFTFTPMSGVSGYFYTTLDQRMHSGSMLSLHYRLVYCHIGQWVEPQVIFVLHWISGCTQEACWVCTSYSLFHFLTNVWSQAVGSVCGKHVKSAPQPCSLSHGAMSGASGYFYTTLDQWLYVGSMLCLHYSLLHFLTNEWSQAVGSE